MSAIVRSFFIPSIDYSISKATLKEWFLTYGEVCRIDLVSHNKPTGLVRRAYIQFSSYTYENIIENDIKTKGYCDHLFSKDNVTYTFRILINNNPIPQTELNLDQVASNTIFIGDQVQEMAQRIQFLENIIGQMDNTLRVLIHENATIKQHLNVNLQQSVKSGSVHLQGNIAPCLSTDL